MTSSYFTFAPASNPKPVDEDTTPGINEKKLDDDVKKYSDGRFDGRQPGTPTGESVVDELIKDLKAAGIAPGNKGSYKQAISGISITADPAKTAMSFTSSKDPSLDGKFATDAIFWTPHYPKENSPANKVDVKDSDIVFVGYGIEAPEYGWNDYVDANGKPLAKDALKGKTVIFLDREPGQGTNTDKKFFKGPEMTKHALRWEKFKKAAEYGASAALMIPFSGSAASWARANDGLAGLHGFLKSDNTNKTAAAIEGVLHQDYAKKLLSSAGLDYDKLKEQAGKQGFKPVDLTQLSGRKFNATTTSTVEHIVTYNVIGKLVGSEAPKETVIYSAHWDHLGSRPKKGADDDNIYNGAVDNASGMGAVLGIARQAAVDAKLNKKNAKPTQVFFFTSYEEKGMLGAKAYMKDPIFDPKKTVVDLNFDELVPGPEAEDLVLIGQGSHDGDARVAQILWDLQRRKLSNEPDEFKAQAYLYRHDGNEFSKGNTLLAENKREHIPNIMSFGGMTWGGNPRAGIDNTDAYETRAYHKTADNYDPKWRDEGLWRGPVKNIKVLYAVGQSYANSNDWINWLQKSEYYTGKDRGPAAKPASVRK